MPKYNLTTEQWEELIEQYVELIVDGMDWKTMAVFVTEQLKHELGEYQDRQDILEDIRLQFDDETLEELVDNVTTTTYSLNVDESITFPVHKE
jgi:hypothetical protein